MDTDKRISWDSYFISIAELAARRSSCERLHVGCVIVKDNRIISTGYNGHIEKLPHTSIVINDHEQNTVHAEVNAISQCAKLGISSNDTKIYITHYPCINCTKLLLSSGIKKIYYINDYKNDELVKTLLDNSKIPIIKFTDIKTY